MFGLTGMASRVAQAILYGLVVFIVIYLIGILLGSFNAEMSSFLKQWAALVGVLAGVVVFFTGNRNVV